ncbi:hypothetical protein BC940DRAFT_331195 [Gongronella butleri]|nr:hypothetical protein BC940DRAFT_331195 [Gongronella butleri]
MTTPTSLESSPTMATTDPPHDKPVEVTDHVLRLCAHAINFLYSFLAVFLTSSTSSSSPAPPCAADLARLEEDVLAQKYITWEQFNVDLVRVWAPSLASLAPNTEGYQAAMALEQAYAMYQKPISPPSVPEFTPVGDHPWDNEMEIFVTSLSSDVLAEARHDALHQIIESSTRMARPQPLPRLFLRNEANTLPSGCRMALLWDFDNDKRTASVLVGQATTFFSASSDMTQTWTKFIPLSIRRRIHVPSTLTASLLSLPAAATRLAKDDESEPMRDFRRALAPWQPQQATTQHASHLSPMSLPTPNASQPTTADIPSRSNSPATVEASKPIEPVETIEPTPPDNLIDQAPPLTTSTSSSTTTSDASPNPVTSDEYSKHSRIMFDKIKELATEKQVDIVSVERYYQHTQLYADAAGYFKQVRFVHNDPSKVVQTFQRMTTSQRTLEIVGLLKLKGKPHIGEILEVLHAKDNPDDLIGLSMRRYSQTLKQYTHPHSHHALTAYQKMDIVRQMVQCIECIHAEGIAHRDLSEVNFMVDEARDQPPLADGTFGARVYLIDFGKAIFLTPDEMKRWWIEPKPDDDASSTSSGTREDELATGSTPPSTTTPRTRRAPDLVPLDQYEGEVMPRNQEELAQWCMDLPWVRVKPDHGYRHYRSIQTLPRNRTDQNVLPWLVNPFAEDMYSIMTLIWKVFTSTEPWHGILDNDLRALRDIVRDDANMEARIDKEVPGKHSKALLLLCLRAHPDNRKNAAQVLAWLDRPGIRDALRSEWAEYAPDARKKRRAKTKDFEDEQARHFPGTAASIKRGLKRGAKAQLTPPTGRKRGRPPASSKMADSRETSMSANSPPASPAAAAPSFVTALLPGTASPHVSPSPPPHALPIRLPIHPASSPNSPKSPNSPNSPNSAVIRIPQAIRNAVIAPQSSSMTAATAQTATTVRIPVNILSEKRKSPEIENDGTDESFEPPTKRHEPVPELEHAPKPKRGPGRPPKSANRGGRAKGTAKPISPPATRSSTTPIRPLAMAASAPPPTAISSHAVPTPMASQAQETPSLSQLQPMRPLSPIQPATNHIRIRLPPPPPPPPTLAPMPNPPFHHQHPHPHHHAAAPPPPHPFPAHPPPLMPLAPQPCYPPVVHSGPPYYQPAAYASFPSSTSYTPPPPTQLPQPMTPHHPPNQFNPHYYNQSSTPQ